MYGFLVRKIEYAAEPGIVGTQRARHNATYCRTARRNKSYILVIMPNALRQLTMIAPSDLEHQFILRGLIFCGQSGAIVLTSGWLDASTSWVALAVIIGLCVPANALCWLALNRIRPEPALLIQLLIDLIALGSLLYFTGGAINPLIWLLLLPLSIAAAVLPRRHTWLAALTACAIYTVLMWFYRPIPGMRLPGDSGFALHVLGMWVGFIISALLITHFLSRMAANVRARDHALARAREQALRDEKLVSMGALATGAAHDLGTPLGTLAILTEELAADIDASETDAAHRKLELMDAQIERCKQVIADIASSAGVEAAQGGHALALAEFIDTTIVEWRLQRTGIDAHCHINGSAPGPSVVADKNLARALTNLFDNAADASPSDVNIAADWNEDTLTLSVSDRGDGFQPDHQCRIGQTPFTDKPNGYGLGLYLACGIIDRMGGRLSIRPRLGGGTVTEVDLPLAGLRV